MIKLKEVLKYMFYLFCVIVTVQVIYILALSEIRGMNATIDYRDLQTILLSSFAGVLPIIITLNWTESVSRRVYFLLFGLHFILTIGFVFGTLYYRNAIERGNLITTIALFSAIYIGINIRNELHNKKTMDELNKRISATHKH